MTTATMVLPVDWQLHGTIALCESGWPQFPKMPKVPGLYRITLKDGRCYIGETADLRRRLQEYRRPTRGLEQEDRIYAALISSGTATIEIFTEGDLSTKTARSRLEKAEIKAAMASNIILLNNDGRTASQRLELRIAYLERELAAARTAHAALKK